MNMAIAIMCFLAFFADAVESRPNILLIVADDLRFDAIGHFTKEVISPNIDFLFQNGFHFRNAYSQAS
jgi:arylsulfatase A-like enzyme